MSNALTSKEALFELIESAEQARNADILQRAHEATATDRQLDEEFDWKSLVVTEAVRLAARIDFLGRHPKLPKFLGGCTIGINKLERGRRVDFITEPVMALQPEYLGDYALRSYFQFEVDHFDIRQEDVSLLKIYGISEETNSGLQKKDELYRITAHPHEYRNFWKVQGPEFGKYRAQKHHEIGEEYKQQNPWFDKFYAFRADGGWVVEPHGMPKTYKENQALSLQRDKIREELIPKLDPGPDTWEYPAELYHFPLGLILQAHEVFGTKQR